MWFPPLLWKIFYVIVRCHRFFFLFFDIIQNLIIFHILKWFKSEECLYLSNLLLLFLKFFQNHITTLFRFSWFKFGFNKSNLMIFLNNRALISAYFCAIIQLLDGIQHIILNSLPFGLHFLLIKHILLVL